MKTHPPSTHQVPFLSTGTPLLKLKKAEGKDPPSYVKRFEQQLKTVKGYIGSAFTGSFTKQMPECKANTYKHDAGKITTLLKNHIN